MQALAARGASRFGERRVPPDHGVLGAGPIGNALTEWPSFGGSADANGLAQRGCRSAPPRGRRGVLDARVPGGPEWHHVAPVWVRAPVGGLVVNGPFDGPVIRTPDQRLRVFVSSTLRELEPERAAARRAIERLRPAPPVFQ